MHPFTQDAAESVGSLGERKLIEAIRTWLGSASPKAPFGIGDDCAVLPSPRGKPLLTVDPVIYREHFNDTVPARAVGEKLFKRNLSDIAAMGGKPLAAVVALALDATVSLRWLREFYRGLAAVSRRYHVPLVGGDIAQLRGGIAATMTLLGETGNSRVVTRTGARLGDWIYVTGQLGGSLQGRHWRFEPRLAEGAWLARQPEVRAMMDVSDGLAKDIPALTPKRTRATLYQATVPVSRAARKMARSSGRPPLEHALGDGEDYELVFVARGGTDRPRFEKRWQRTFPQVRLSCVGRFEHLGDPLLPGEMTLAGFSGFEHLAASSS